MLDFQNGVFLVKPEFKWVIAPVVLANAEDMMKSHDATVDWSRHHSGLCFLCLACFPVCNCVHTGWGLVSVIIFSCDCNNTFNSLVLKPPVSQIIMQFFNHLVTYTITLRCSSSIEACLWFMFNYWHTWVNSNLHYMVQISLCSLFSPCLSVLN